MGNVHATYSHPPSTSPPSSAATYEDTTVTFASSFSPELEFAFQSPQPTRRQEGHSSQLSPPGSTSHSSVEEGHVRMGVDLERVANLALLCRILHRDDDSSSANSETFHYCLGSELNALTESERANEW